MAKLDKIRKGALRAMLRPIVRLCLRSSLGIQTLVETAKEVFVELAAEEINRSGERLTASRVSVITGLHRRDVQRLLEGSAPKETQGALVARVIGQWEQDLSFRTKGGAPKVLSTGTSDSEFHRLVETVSKDVNPGTVLRELERIGAVEQTDRGAKLVARAYNVGERVEEGMAILTSDVDDLVVAVEENLLGAVEVPNLHGRTEYDNISSDALPEIREWIFNEGSTFHRKVRDYLSRFDRDINPSVGGKGGARVVFSTFSRMSD